MDGEGVVDEGDYLGMARRLGAGKENAALGRDQQIFLADCILSSVP